MMVDLEEVNVYQFCRICFEHKPGLVSCHNILVIEDFTCTVEEILSLLSSQEVKAFPTYPSKICPTCKALAEATFALKIMYEKTSEVLRNLLTPFPQEKIKVESDFEETDNFDETLTYIEQYHPLEDKINNSIENYNEEQIILKIEDDEPAVHLDNALTKNEKRNLYSKNRRHLEKQQDLILGAKIDQEIEETLNHSEINLKKPGNVTHLCPICWIEMTDPREFKKHIQTHKVLKSYFKGIPVSEESKFVAKPSNIVSIFNRPDAVHWCPYCNEELPALEFGIHLWNHERLDEFYCKKCDRIFLKLRDFNLHKVRSHREEYPYKCEECDQGFVIKYNFECHMLKHTSNEEDLPYACQECPRKFSNPVHLWRHMHIHNGKGVYGSQYKTYKCTKCKQYFRTIRVYEDHFDKCNAITTQKITGPVTRGQKKEYHCRLCEKTFRTYAGLYQHVRKTHEKKHKKKICEVCGKAVYNMTYHMYSHTGQKQTPRICDVCGKSFTMVQNYFRHYKALHTAQEPYLCDVCGKSFRHYDSFKMHERIHIGNKCHICPVCGKGFLEKAYMKKHLRVHDKSKAFRFLY